LKFFSRCGGKISEKKNKDADQVEGGPDAKKKKKKGKRGCQKLDIILGRTDGS